MKPATGSAMSLFRAPRRVVPLLGLLLLGLPRLCLAGPDVQLNRLHIDVKVERDGSYVETTDLIEQLNSERAVHDAGQIKLPYSASLDTFEIVEAQTLKKRGETVRVPASSIFVQDGLISDQGVTSYQDIKTTVVVFPNLEAGDSVRISYKRSRRKPALPGIYTFTHVFEPTFVTADAVITLDAPKDYPLTVEAVDVGADPAQTAGDRVRYRWTYHNSNPQWPEDRAIDAVAYAPRILVSSAASYGDIAAASRTTFAGKAAVTPQVKALAADITKGAKTPREQAQRIHEWVSRNIRYFAIVLDVGGYVPRDADEILSSRFGDCKDHAIMMQALLAARGIAAVPALLTTEALYDFPKVPVMSSFNHVILYVPSLDAWLESNVRSIPFGVLPYQDADKPVVLLDGQGTLARTPAVTGASNRMKLSTRITVAADGSASGQDRVDAAGAYGVFYQAYADALQASDPVKLTKAMLINAGLAGEGTAVAQPISNAADFNLSMLYDLPDYAPMQQPGSLHAVPPMDMMATMARDEVSSAPTRKLVYACFPSDEEEDIDLVLPPGVHVSVPQGVSAEAPGRSYTSTYAQQGNVVHIQRHYVATYTRNTCPPENYPKVRALMERILLDMRSDIRYDPPQPAVAH